MQPATMAITFNGTNHIIRQNAEGLYSMNDLHEASGGAKKAGPNYWLDLKGTKALIAELGHDLGTPEIPVVVTINGGNDRGSWIHEPTLEPPLIVTTPGIPGVLFSSSSTRAAVPFKRNQSLGWDFLAPPLAA